MNLNPIEELSSHLKQLRLSGILESLDQRNRQAIEGTRAQLLGHLARWAISRNSS
jgi:hypothetical protein